MQSALIGAQLYTVRAFTRTPAELAVTLSRIRAIGYPAVQVSAIGPCDVREVARMLEGEGLACCATHVPFEELRRDPAAVIETHRLWRCDHVAIGGYFPEAPGAGDWDRFADELNDVAAAFAGSGVRVGYHNHSHELARFDGRTALARLVDRLDPAVFLELDTYWLAHGGGDPAAWVASLPGRVPCVHLKDLGVAYPSTVQMREVGEGNLNWPAVLAACRAASVEWHVVEQDDCNGRDPFDCLGVSLRNLLAMREDDVTTETRRHGEEEVETPKR